MEEFSSPLVVADVAPSAAAMVGVVVVGSDCSRRWLNSLTILPLRLRAVALLLLLPLLLLLR